MRRILVLLPLAPLLVLAGTSSAGAVSPGPINLPAVQLVAQNACTGKAVPGLSATLSPTSGEVSPGPTQRAGLTHRWKTVAPGTYALILSAPGMVGIGGAGTSPISVEVSPGPSQLVANSFFQQGQIVSVAMVPTTIPPSPCFDLSAPTLPEMSGVVFDGKTRAPLASPGPISLSVPGEVSPGPISYPGGAFVFPAGAVAPGSGTLSVSAPGYLPLGNAAGGGVPVTCQPGPQQLPGGDSFSEGQAVVVGLAPG